MSGLNASEKSGRPWKTPRNGWPTTAHTLDIVQKVKEPLSQDHHVTVRMIEEEVGINHETAHLIVTQDLGKRKLCSRLVPHNLTPEQLQLRLDACADFIDMVDQDPNFLKTIVTGNESCCLKYDPEGKHQSMEWRGPGSLKKKKMRSEKSHIKAMLMVFLDYEGLIHKEFLPEDTTMNAATYMKILKHLLQQIKRVCLQYTKQGDWTLLHDNALPHTAFLVQQFLAKRGVVSLNHPLYSPNCLPWTSSCSPN